MTPADTIRTEADSLRDDCMKYLAERIGQFHIKTGLQVTRMDVDFVDSWDFKHKATHFLSDIEFGFDL